VIVSAGALDAGAEDAATDGAAADVEAATGADVVAAGALLDGAAAVFAFDEQPATARAATATTPTSARRFLRAMNMDPPGVLREDPLVEATRFGDLRS
jgi:predicted nicotinamide N-methyase